MSYSIIPGRMGCFLNPPGDAEYKWEVRGPEEMISLRGALKLSHIPEDIKKRVRKLLDDNPGDMTEEWVRECYAYFAGCYSQDGKERAVDKIVWEGPPEFHAAFLHIRDFFPDAKPREDLIQTPPRWGQKQ